MKTVKEMIGSEYVLIPLYVDTGCGYQTVERYDMSHAEWRAWMNAKDLKAVKKILSNDVATKTKRSDIIAGLKKISDFLVAEGVESALITSVDCNVLREKYLEQEV